MLKIAFKKVRPEKEQVLRDWMAELGRRKKEVRESFKQETMRHEAAYILKTAEGPVLVYGMEAESYDKMIEAYKASKLPIDVEHGKVLKETLTDDAPAELIYECSLE